jgi:hypothetical protein
LQKWLRREHSQQQHKVPNFHAIRSLLPNPLAMNLSDDVFCAQFPLVVVLALVLGAPAMIDDEDDDDEKGRVAAKPR